MRWPLEQAKLEAILQAGDGSQPGKPKLEVAADALRLPPWDASIEHLSLVVKSGRVAPCRLLLSVRHVVCSMKPTNHLDADSVALAGAFPARLPRTVVAINPRRYFLE